MKICRIPLILIFCFSVSTFPDTIKLKNGKVYENTRVKIQTDKIIIEFESGKKMSILKKFAKSLKPSPVKWKNRKAVVDTYEIERIRTAELLLQNQDWKPKEDEKPRLMILKFKAGRGVKSAQAEALSNEIRTEIINIELFVVLDRLTMEKEIKEKKCKNIACAKEIAANYKVNKLLTGEITYSSGEYFIEGEVIDVPKKSVDFSESVRFTKEKNEKEAIRSFAKKICGGTLEFWDEAFYNPKPEQPPITPYIWRSALIPGWGQWEKSHPYRAITILSTILITGGFYLPYKKDFQNTKSSYDTWKNLSLLNQSRTFNPYVYYFAEEERKSANRKRKKVNIVVGVLAGIYALNLLDVIFSPIPMELHVIPEDQTEQIETTALRYNKTSYYLSFIHRF